EGVAGPEVEMLPLGGWGRVRRGQVGTILVMEQTLAVWETDSGRPVARRDWGMVEKNPQGDAWKSDDALRPLILAASFTPKDDDLVLLTNGQPLLLDGKTAEDRQGLWKRAADWRKIRSPLGTGERMFRLSWPPRTPVWFDDYDLHWWATKWPEPS